MQDFFKKGLQLFRSPRKREVHGGPEGPSFGANVKKPTSGPRDGGGGGRPDPRHPSPNPL